MVDIALMPEVAHLVDIRHSSVYGNAFAIVDIAMCLGLTVSKENKLFLFYPNQL